MRRGITVAALFIGIGAAHAQCPTPRMPREQSAAIKRSLLPPGARMGDYELDHVVPLCLCGSNDRENLQLQPWSDARRKDELEAALCRAVEWGLMTRDEAIRRLREWQP